MALLIPEIQLFRVIEKLFSAVKTDFNNHVDENQTILFRLFGGKKVGKFDFYEQSKEIFVNRLPEHPRQLKTRLFYDTERASLPTVHITLPSEATGQSGLGTDEGFVDELHEGGKSVPILTRRFDLQYNIIITSDNSFETILIYYTLRSLLISTFVQLSFEGLENPKLSGQDLRLYSEIIPRNVFARAINLSVSYEDSSPSLFSKDEITSIIFDGKLEVVEGVEYISVHACLPVIITDAENPESPLSVEAGGTYECTECPSGCDTGCQPMNDLLTQTERNRIQRIAPIKTGQTISYVEGDDGDREYGRGVDFFTLDCNNPFGNTNRFTDENGLQVYGNYYMIDHLGDEGLGWYMKSKGKFPWATAMANVLTDTTLGYDNWFIPNVRQLFALVNFGYAVDNRTFNYEPINNFNTATFWAAWTGTSTPRTGNTYAHIIYNYMINTVSDKIKTSTIIQMLICRKHIF